MNSIKGATSFSRASGRAPAGASFKSSATVVGGEFGTFNPAGSAIFGGTQPSTAPINYRGQDKRVEPTIGQNPNANIEDEYIHNLQQQIHFMELELKILKEKITEDEKNTGIGSLFKDEKTSHQHIGLLKTKY